MDIKVIGTGSDGNSFLFNDGLMVDVGLPFSRLKKIVDIESLSTVLLTHIHGDHFNKTSIRKMYVENEKLVFACGEYLKDDLLGVGIPLDNIHIVEAGSVYSFCEFKISPVIAYHDVENFGYRIVLDDHKHLHITDTAHLEGITAINYDTATIECNHCEIKALELIEKAKEDKEFSHLSGAMASHLSVQQTKTFCKTNKIKKLIPVHIGNSTRKEVIQNLKEW